MKQPKPTILITGASRGIGAAVAAEAGARGWHVVGTCTRRRAGMPPCVAEWIECDFGDPGATDVMGGAIRRMPRLDALVNNAGINIIKGQADVGADDYGRIESVDLRLPYFVGKAAAVRMAGQEGGGRILNIASIWSVATKPGRTLYSTMKTGLLGMTRGMAVEWGSRGVLVNALSPGFVLTDLTRESLSDAEREALAGQVPLGRLADPAEIARAVLFLCGPENTYLTGQNVVVDGGFTIV